MLVGRCWLLVYLSAEFCCVRLQASAQTQQSRLKEQSSTQTTYLDEIEELTHKLSQAENRIKQFETSRLEDGAKVNVDQTE